MGGFWARRGNHNQNKRDSIKEAKKKIFSGPEERGEEGVMLIMCARQTQRENKRKGGGEPDKGEKSQFSLCRHNLNQELNP